MYGKDLMFIPLMSTCYALLRESVNKRLALKAKKPEADERERINGD